MSAPTIPLTEYNDRIKQAAKLIADADLDVMVANSNEADYSSVRYFSAFWPLFEMAGVAIAPSADVALMVGMESEIYAKLCSTVSNIHMMKEYRETADPSFPGLPASSYKDVFDSIGVKNPKRIGIAGYLCTNLAMYEGLRTAFPDAELVKADDLVMTPLRRVKSPAEIACLREGLRIGELAAKAMIDAIKPGMTELQLAGIGVETIYRNGGESEAHAIYSFGGAKSSNAISRSSHRVFEKGDIVQIGVGGRVDGYSPSVGRPICLGKMTDHQRRLISYGREMHYKTFEMMQSGAVSGEVARLYEATVKKDGMGEYYLYGPCHGLGLIEVEKPWLESTSTYKLEPNMTFQADTFFYDEKKEFGLRWENGVLISTKGKAEMLNAGRFMDIIEVDC